MKVGFYLADQNPHRDKTRGISVYTENLIRELAKFPDLKISTYRSRSSIDPLGETDKSSRFPFRTDTQIPRLAVDQLHPLFPRPDVDLWHYPKGFLPFAFAPRTPLVGTVHDMILQHYADKYPALRSTSEYAYWLAILRRSLPRFDVVLTDSEFSKRQIQDFCKRNKLRCPQISVVYLGLPTYWPIEDWGPKENYVLHLASSQPHKRTNWLLRTWLVLSQNSGDLPHLFLVGKTDNEGTELCRRISNVRLQVELSEGDLAKAYARARALILPSEIEGFGLPALEAYAVGTPVVFTEGTSVREILGADAPGAFATDDIESFRVALDEALLLSPSSIRLRAALLRQQFNWEGCAKGAIAAYRSVLNSKK